MNKGEQFIYIAQDQISGNIKIGISADPEKRLKELQTGNASPIKLISYFQGTADIERNLHSLYAKDRVNGEWFAPTEDLLGLANYCNGRDMSNNFFTANGIGKAQQLPLMIDPSGLGANDETVGRVYKTRDYGRFQVDPVNRKLKRSTLKKLKASIQEKNLLHMVPIIVDNGWYIIDGQHRFEIAKELGLDIYYIRLSKDIIREDIVRLNNNRDNWNLEDYQDSFVAQGKDMTYYLIKVFWQKYVGQGINLSQCLKILHKGFSGGQPVADYKKGKFELTRNQRDFGHVVASRILDYRKNQHVMPQNHQKILNNEHFLFAMKRVCANEGYDHEACIAKFQAGYPTITPSRTIRGYIDQIEKLQNHRRKKDNRVTFS